jgi:hypothetical protein
MENSRRSGRIARKSSLYEERKKQAEELENKLKVIAFVSHRFETLLLTLGYSDFAEIPVPVLIGIDFELWNFQF